MAKKETVGGVSVYVPTGDPAAVAAYLASRLKSVRGARIGILDNCKEFADLVLRGVADAQPADRLVIRIGGGEPISYEVGGPALDPDFLPHFSRLVRVQESRVNADLFNRVAAVLPSLIEGRGEFLIEAGTP